METRQFLFSRKKPGETRERIPRTAQSQPHSRAVSGLSSWDRSEHLLFRFLRLRGRLDGQLLGVVGEIVCRLWKAHCEACRNHSLQLFSNWDFCSRLVTVVSTE